MNVSKDKVVSLSYVLREENEKGKILETVQVEKPLVFLVGAGNLLPKFEENLNGLKTGEKFGFILEYKDAYGEIDDGAIIDVPVNVFMKEGKIEEGLLDIGNQIPMRDNEGNQFTGIVRETAEESVKMDFNHPLAGTNLHFSGEVIDIRNATEDEMARGHAHGPDICKGCTDEDCSHNE